MSGGYFDYKQYQIEEILDQIKRIVQAVNNNELGSPEDCDDSRPSHWTKSLVAESKPEVLKEFENAIEILSKASVYAQRIDWFLSGDDGEESFLRRLKEELEEIK
jgi:hypothetical protein